MSEIGAAMSTATLDGDTLVTAGSDRYLTFALGGEVFALPILDITEIMEYRNLTVVPMMPDFVRGVINLRGRVVPVVDMAARFGRGTTQIARRTSIIIVETPAGDDGDDTQQDMGIMVDAVNKVVHLAADDIEPPPAFGAGIRADFISGMARYDGEFIIVLDVTHVLSMDEMVQLSRAAVTGHRILDQHHQHDAGRPAQGQAQGQAPAQAQAEAAQA
jgi:purine-binding chemotaxis protein CheW